MITGIRLANMTPITEVIGIDYSMTSPVICRHPSHIEWSWQNCIWHFLSDRERSINHSRRKNKRPRGQDGVCYFGHSYPTYEYQIDRFAQLARWVIWTPWDSERGREQYNLHMDDQVYLEDYSYGSRGMNFDVGENTGILKFALWDELKIKPEAVSPSVTKKTAGKGNLDKWGMYRAFKEETGEELLEIFGHSLTIKQIPHPVEDIVDAYYVAKTGWLRLNRKQT